MGENFSDKSLNTTVDDDQVPLLLRKLQLKKSKKVHEASPNALKSSFKYPLGGQREKESSSLKKRRMNDVMTLQRDGEVCKEVPHPLMTDIVAFNSDREIQPLKEPIPEEVLKNICVGQQHAKEVMIQKIDMESQIDTVLDEQNAEFLKVKYLHGEYKRKLDVKIKKILALKSQLEECRAELAIISTTLSLQNREVGRSRTELIEACMKTNKKNEALKALAAEKSSLEIMNKELQNHLREKEAAILDMDAHIEDISLKAIEKFKKSSAYRLDIQNRVQEAYDKLFDVEVRDLKRQCLEEGFVRGFLKGARLVQSKVGVTIEGLSPSQASEDSFPYLDVDDDDDDDGGGGVESELRKAFSSDDEEV